jgi:hypothetical protein
MIAPNGAAVSGACVFQAVQSFASGVFTVVGAPLNVAFTNGSLTVALLPTSSLGQYYKVTCQIPSQVVQTLRVDKYSWGPRYWNVPTSLVPVNNVDIEINNVLPPSVFVLLSQISLAGSSPGDCITNVAGVAAWRPCGTGGSSSGGPLFDSTSGLFDSGLGLFDTH